MTTPPLENPVDCSEALKFFEVRPQRPVKAATTHILNALHRIFEEKPNIEDHEGVHYFDVPDTELLIEIKGAVQFGADPDSFDEKALKIFLAEKNARYTSNSRLFGSMTGCNRVVSKRSYYYSTWTGDDNNEVTSSLFTRNECHGRGYGAALGYTTHRIAGMMHRAWSDGHNTTCELTDNSLYKGTRGWSSRLAQELSMGEPATHRNSNLAFATTVYDIALVPVYHRILPASI